MQTGVHGPIKGSRFFPLGQHETYDWAPQGRAGRDVGGHQRTFVQIFISPSLPPFSQTCGMPERASAEREAHLQITLMTTGAWLPRSRQPPYQRDRVLRTLRKRRCTPVPRPRTRRACRIGTARTTCAVCQSDCIYPRASAARSCASRSRRWWVPLPVRGATLWPPFPPKPHFPPPSATGSPCLQAAPRGLLLYLLTIPCPHRYTQHPRGSALSAPATSFSCPGPRCRSDARICATSGGDHASRSRDSLVGSLYVRG
jgi:hypothetical protein